MLALFKSQNLYEQHARQAYAAVLTRVREPAFYAAGAVPDTIDGRFDLMVIHLFLLIDRALAEGRPGRDFNQALFDAVFADMDQGLRESGVGDMGVPKHMRRMMKGFNGRVQAYAEAIDDEEALRGVIARNLYGTLPQVPAGAVAAMAAYMRSCRGALLKCGMDDIHAGHGCFAEVNF